MWSYYGINIIILYIYENFTYYRKHYNEIIKFDVLWVNKNSLKWLVIIVEIRKERLFEVLWKIICEIEFLLLTLFPICLL